MTVKKPVCECGYIFTSKDITRGVRPIADLNLPHDFYGGNVKYYCSYDCKCGKKYLLFTRPEANSHKIKIIAEVNTVDKENETGIQSGEQERKGFEQRQPFQRTGGKKT